MKTFRRVIIQRELLLAREPSGHLGRLLIEANGFQNYLKCFMQTLCHLESMTVTLNTLSQ